jgi:hypothetical protein
VVSTVTVDEIGGGNVTGCEITRLVSVSDTIVKVLEPPGNSVVEIFNVVSLF